MMHKKTFDSICAELEQGAFGLSKICKARKISPQSFYDYMEESGDESAKERYARAVYNGCDTIAEEILEIAEKKSDPRDRQVKIDARKWLLSKRFPKKYGDKLDLNANVNATTKVIRLPAKSQEGAPIE